MVGLDRSAAALSLATENAALTGLAEQVRFVRGDANELKPWRDSLLPRLAPGQSAYFIPADAADLPELLASKTADGLSAWICEGFSCRAPITDLDSLIAAIETPAADNSTE